METTTPRPRRISRLIRWTIAIGFLLVTLGYASVSLVVAHVLTRTNNHPNTTDPRDVSENARAWSFKTSDGLTLRGWYCPTPAKRRLVVLVHGMGGSLDQMAGIGHDLHAKGYDVLLFDLRGHGSSDPSRLYMGSRERNDLRAVLAWAEQQGFSPDRIGWLGHSMGASTLLMEAADNVEIKALVLDSPFGNLPELLDRQLTRHSHLPKLFNPGILLAARFAFGVRTDNLIPLHSAEELGSRPMLVIHGEDDSIVPVRQARQIVETLGSSCQYVFLPGVEHVGAYNQHRNGYIVAVDRFFDQNLTH